MSQQLIDNYTNRKQYLENLKSLAQPFQGRQEHNEFLEVVDDEILRIEQSIDLENLKLQTLQDAEVQTAVEKLESVLGSRGATFWGMYSKEELLRAVSDIDSKVLTPEQQTLGLNLLFNPDWIYTGH